MFTALIAILLATSTFAAPSPLSGCDASQKQLPIPSGQTQLVLPATTVPSFIGLGVGVQNYTCGTTGTFTNIGAVAELFDISCAQNEHFSDLTDVAFAIWKATPKDISIQDLIKTLAFIDPAFRTPLILGQHYFVTNPITGTGVNAKWDFTSASLKGHSDAFVVGARTGDIPAPSSPAVNVDWLSLSSIQGNLADQVFRVETRSGQPPSSCTAGDSLSVKYVSQYWFFGGSFA